MHIRLPAGIVIGLSALVGTLGAQEIESGRVVGCFDLRLEEWTPPFRDSLSMMLHLPPPRVFFEDQAFSLPHGFPVSPAPGSRPSPHRFASWRTEGDRVKAVWSTGFWGVRMDLGFDGKALVGSATTFTDVRPVEDYHAAVRAEPVPCDSPPDYPLAGSRWVPRAVELSSGTVIELGKSLPDNQGVVASSGRRRVEFSEGTVGPFQGAENVRVSLTDGGLVGTILLDYPETMDVDSIHLRIQESMDSEGKGRPGSRSPMVYWSDWLTSISIHDGGDRHHVLLRDHRLG